MIPIGVIVAVAIICVVVAVLGSAQRADEVAVATERQLFTRALHNHGERMLREVDAVANSEAAYRKIRLDFDIEWVQVYVGQRLQSYFDHHFVFVADPSDRLLYATLGSGRVDPNWFNSVRADLNPALDQLRGRSHAPCRQRARRRQSAAEPRRRASASPGCKPSSAARPSSAPSRSRAPTTSRAMARRRRRS